MDDEMELGMGLHGESGAQKLKLLPCRQTIDLVISQLILNSPTLGLQPTSNVLLFANNLGWYFHYIRNKSIDSFI
jgi:dihydroxyacetone kinase